MAAQDLDQFFVNDLDHLLRRGERVQHLLAYRLLLDVFYKLFDNLEVDVGFEERHADFAQSGLHVFGRKLPFAAQVFEDPLELISRLSNKRQTDRKAFRAGPVQSFYYSRLFRRRRRRRRMRRLLAAACRSVMPSS